MPREQRQRVCWAETRACSTAGQGVPHQPGNETLKKEEEMAAFPVQSTLKGFDFKQGCELRHVLAELSTCRKQEGKPSSTGNAPRRRSSFPILPPKDPMVAVFSPFVDVLGLVPVVSLLAAIVVSLLFRSPQPRGVYRPTSTLPVLGNLYDMFHHEPRFHDWIADQFVASKGTPVVTKSPGLPDMVLIASPELVEDVVKTQFDHFDKGAHQRGNLVDLLGGGILATDGHSWIHQRKTSSNLFSMRALRDSMASIIRKHTVTLRALLDDTAASNSPLDLFRLMNRFTIESFAEIGFGVRMNCLAADSEMREHPFQTAFDSVQYQLTQRFRVPVWLWKLMKLLNLGWEARLKVDLAVIDDTVLEIITESLDRRRLAAQQPQEQREQLGKEKKVDIISLFLDHAEASDDNKSIDPKLLRDIVVNFLMAGRDTTAQALSWFFFSLSTRPEVEKKLRGELRLKFPALFKQRAAINSVELLSVEDLQSLVYLEACLKETLRLYPSIPFIFRSACKPTTLSNGTFVPKGSNLGISTYSMGRMTYIWGEDALEFKPERWIDEATGKLRIVSPYKFSAFHGGPRMCLGMNLSMLEMKIVVAGVVSRFNIRTAPGQHVTYTTSLTLGMKGAFMVDVTRIEDDNEALDAAAA
ncbi:Cytochrome p450, partial [Globisporangium splendens]